MEGKIEKIFTFFKAKFFTICIFDFSKNKYANKANIFQNDKAKLIVMLLMLIKVIKARKLF